MKYLCHRLLLVFDSRFGAMPTATCPTGYDIYMHKHMTGILQKPDRIWDTNVHVNKFNLCVGD